MAQTVINKRIAALRYDYAARATVRPPVCNLCGARNRAVKVAERDRYGYPARLVQCRRCGLAYLCPQLDATQYEHFYSKVYRPLVSAYHGRRIDAHTVQHDQRAYAAELAPFLFPLLPSPPRTILDVGGSTGVVAKALADRVNATVTVLDPAPDELAVARAAGMETIAGFVEDFDPERRTWDLVLLCQTIDHLLDVHATVDAIRRFLAPDGAAFVDVLDVEFMARRRGSVEGAVKIDHPYYLTRDTALGYFARSGLDVVAERMSADGHWGFLLRAGEPREPDWPALRARGERLLATFWRLRA